MEQEELLEYLKEEMEFAKDLWEELPTDSKTESFRNYLLVQITSTIFGKKASNETLEEARAYFTSLDFDVFNSEVQVLMKD